MYLNLNKAKELSSRIKECQRPKGVWVLHDGYYCSNCHYKLETTAIPNFCPNCGAKMNKGGETESEDE